MATDIRTLLTGATGTLGSELRPRLGAAGHAVRGTSRNPPAATDDVEWVEMDLESGTGVREAVTDVDVVVHAASDAVGDSEAVDVEGTRRLLEAAGDADIANFVYISIVGIESIPYSYYEHKLAAERAIEASDVPATILRTTQFHAFVDELLGYVARLPVWPLPTRMRLQPVDEGAVADRLVAHATMEAHGRLDPMGGPAVHSVRELAEAYRAARGKRRPIVRLPIPGGVFSAFRDGEATCPDHATETRSWNEWLAARYAE